MAANKSAGAYLTPPPSDAFQVLTQVAATKFLIEGVQPPSRVYVALNDMLRIDAICMFAPTTVRVVGRLLRTDGQIVPIEHDVVLAAAGVLVTATFQEAEGFLLSLAITPTAASTYGASLYVQVGFQRSATGSAVFFDVLTAGYADSLRPLSWPGYDAKRPAQDRGCLRGVTGAGPVAGAEAVLTCPANMQWRIVSVRAQFTAAIAVANRTPRLEYQGPGFLDVDPQLYGPNQIVVASGSITIVWFFGGPPNSIVDTANNLFQAAIPELWLNGNNSIQTLTSGIQAADQWTRLSALVEQYALLT
jgi:hypothetical protein